MQRYIKFSKYRNLGMDEPTTLILNHSIKKGEIGGVVLLIGPNNSGKSNVLDGILSINNGRLAPRDINNHVFEESEKTPVIEYGIRDKEDGPSASITIFHDKTPQIQNSLYPSEELKLPTKETLLNDIRCAMNLYSSHGLGSSGLNQAYNDVNSHQGEITKELVEMVIAQIDDAQDVWEKYNPRQGLRTRHVYTKSAFRDAMPKDGYWFAYSKNAESVLEATNRDCKNEFEIPFLPQIIKYVETPITKENLSVTPDKIEENPFFVSLFNFMGIEVKEIVECYQRFKQFNEIEFVKKLGQKMYKKMAVINKTFNQLFFTTNDPYKFAIYPESEKIFIGMSRGKDKEPLTLDYQSSGFRWFFNLFFNFLLTSKLHPGDIVIMDEPATNLHVGGQEELRDFLMKFGREHGVTFVISTHCPFFVDTDNYDALRVVSTENCRSKINNLFTAVNWHDPDSLKAVKEALTIKQQYVLYEYGSHIVWAEGITDYNYLTMFKNLLGKDSHQKLKFLPFNGAGRNTGEAREILKALSEVKFYGASILCDADEAGQRMKETAKDTCFKDLTLLSDVSPQANSFVEIEDLFNEEDKVKFGIANKSPSQSSVMKSSCKLEDFSKETIENFKSLLDYLAD